MKSYTKPDLLIKLTAEQLKQADELIKKQFAEGGMLLGSLSTSKGGVIGLSFLPKEIALEIVALANKHTENGTLPSVEDE